MNYLGSKNRIAKYIVPIIEKCIKDNDIKYYNEPFIGGGNLYDKIQIEGLNKSGSDLNEYLIELLNYGIYCSKNNINPTEHFPVEVDKPFYDECRTLYRTKKTKPEEFLMVAAVGFFASYNGKFYDGGFAKPNEKRNYYQEKKNNFIKQIPALSKNTDYLKCKSYIEVVKEYTNNDMPTTFFYIDPPYANTTKYNVSKNFDSVLFWENMRTLSNNHFVLISEETAPDDFKVRWEMPVKRAVHQTKNKTATEKLFYYEKGKIADYFSEAIV